MAGIVPVGVEEELGAIGAAEDCVDSQVGEEGVSGMGQVNGRRQQDGGRGQREPFVPSGSAPIDPPVMVD